jgi:hypothetical protein
MELTDLEDAIARNPYGVVAGAIGLGFILGGGLFTRLTARIVGAGLRMGLTAALPVLTDGLLRAANQSVMSTTENANGGTPR